jgi:hypothetical protein
MGYTIAKGDGSFRGFWVLKGIRDLVCGGGGGGWVRWGGWWWWWCMVWIVHSKIINYPKSLSRGKFNNLIILEVNLII